MHAWLVQVCEWLQNTPFVLWLGHAQYAYPFVQLTHFTGLSLWLGTSLVLDFRLLGAGKKFMTAAQLRDAVFVWNWAGLGIAVITGLADDVEISETAAGTSIRMSWPSARAVRT